MILSDKIKNKINSIYDEYNTLEVEVEARIGKTVIIDNKPEFISGVTIQVFNRLKSFFQKTTETKTKTTDYIRGNIRKTVTTPVGDQTDTETIWITKNRIWKETNKYDVRYSVSTEINIDPVENFKPELIREKNRYSYNMFNNSVRLDLTMVDMVYVNKSNEKNTTSYEVEIEILNSNKNINHFDTAIKNILLKVLDTRLLYDPNEATNVITDFNKNLNSINRSKIDHYPMVQARNLKFKDIVWGGLIGNKDTGYSVTHKADGQRKFLFFHNSGVWLISAPHSLNKIHTYNKINGTILDGEIIPKENRLDGAPKTAFWYLAFDCLSFSGNSVQLAGHNERMKYAQKIADNFKNNNNIYINTKTFKNFTTPIDFFKIMREMFVDQNSLKYKQDGFMFTPINTIYNSHSDKLPLYKRILTSVPDICKWKKPEQLTVDFLIKWRATGNGRKIDIYNGKNKSLVKFTGNKLFPYNHDIDSNHPMTLNIPSDSIVEYGWDYERKLLIPHRIRNDKIKPNRIEIAEDVWYDIMKPLDRETLEGNTLTLMRKYHNNIKKRLFYTDKKRTLLDIGSGNGGDVAKWKNYYKIVAVEPNADHIVELKRRLKIHNMENRVRIVNTGGEDYETIYKNVREFIGGRVDTVSMMLSLSFFWKEQKMLDDLVKTIASNIKPDGKMIFFTIDGDLVEQTFEPALGGPLINKLKLTQAELTYNPNKNPKELYIHIEGTIVDNQTEWLVRLGDLSLKMQKYGFDFGNRTRADEQKLLTSEEITLTQMYTYGTLVRTNSNIILPELENFKKQVEIIKEDKKVIKDKKEKVLLEKKEITKKEMDLKSFTNNLGIIALPETEVIKTDITPPILKSSYISETMEPSISDNILLSSDINPPPIGSTLPELPSFDLASLGYGELPTVDNIIGLPVYKTQSYDSFDFESFSEENMAPIEHELPGISPDSIEKLTITWYTNEIVSRIGAIGDGSCFFHASLLSFYDVYQNNKNKNYRMGLVRKLRRDIAYTLQMNDPKNQELTLYETANDGMFLVLNEHQNLGLDLGDNFDFSLTGLQKLFNSTGFLGDEVYQYASDILGIDIYVMRLTNKDLYPHLNTAKKGFKRKAIIISGNGNHYESVGVYRDNLYQTTFDQDDPIILSIRALIEDEGGV